MAKTNNYDVLVIGGGVAGVAAALQAGRQGLKTALIEKTILWGGLATSGLVPIWMPLCDGNGKQVTFGIAEELLYCSLKYGPGRVPSFWGGKNAGKEKLADYDELYPDSGMAKRYSAYFSPAAFVFGMDELLQQTKVDLWLDTLACKPIMSGNKVSGAEVENKSGRIAIKAKMIIDSSGEADMAARAGAPCSLRGSQPSFLYQYTSLKLAQDAVKTNSARKLATWHGGGSANEFGKGYEGKKGIFTGVDGKGLSEFIMESRKVAREKLKKEQDALGKDGRENIYPTSLPSMHQIRMTRKINAEEAVLEKNMNKNCKSSIGMIADCRKRNAVWEVPYGSLIPKKIRNITVAGRCTDADNYGWQVTRLIPAAALTGQVCAIASGLAIKGKTSPDKLDVKDVQNILEKKGIKLHL